MIQITITESLERQLRELDQPAEIVSQSGSRLGKFVPLPAEDSPYSPEELERMRAEKGGRPLAEIWESLKSE